jgi:2-deoxy-D-gluconate 3-dehydrogenase
MSQSAFDLTGKVALVTGAAQGLGQGLALGLAEAGAILVALDRSPLSETLALIDRIGGEAYALHQDLANLTPSRAREIVAMCADQSGGGLDILVNNAGIIRRAPALEHTLEDWQAVLDLDLNSPFFLAQAAARLFVSNEVQGKIINIASMLSFQGGLYVPSYAAAKSAIAGLTRALANEWAPLGINVNALAPGYFATEVTAQIRANPERNHAILDRIPAGRWGDPNDLKGAVVFLASPASDYVHGVVLPVDGGWLAR